MDTVQWPQEMMLSKPPPPTPPVDDMVPSSSSTRPLASQQLVADERRARPLKEHALNCPRCNSNNTKFCYYNNYSLTQPRYFCKTCRRYWTEGGSLRNVPVGGGSRKNKRSSSSSSSPSSSTNANSFATPSLEAPPKKLAYDHLIPTVISSSTTSSSSSSTHHSKFTEAHDLNLAFPHPNPYLDGEFRSPNTMKVSSTNNGNLSTCSSSSASAMELLSSNGVDPSRGFVMNPFLPLMPTVHECSSANYPTGGFGLQELRSAATLNFPVDGVGGVSVYGQNNMQETQEGGGRALFPFEDLRQQVPSNTTQQLEQNKGQGGDSPAGFWNGVMGDGSGW